MSLNASVVILNPQTHRVCRARQRRVRVVCDCWQCGRAFGWGESAYYVPAESPFNLCAVCVEELRAGTEFPRFWSKVSKVGRPGGCWLWLGGLDRHGYGRFYVDGSVGQRNYTGAHRVAYEQVKGPIHDGLQIDHLCRVPRCVNPDHLEAVTQRENLLRGETITARNAAKTHCPQGHEYTPENTYVRQGKRNCRTCVRESNARSRRRSALKGAAWAL